MCTRLNFNPERSEPHQHQVQSGITNQRVRNYDATGDRWHAADRETRKYTCLKFEANDQDETLRSPSYSKLHQRGRRFTGCSTTAGTAVLLQLVYTSSAGTAIQECTGIFPSAGPLTTFERIVVRFARTRTSHCMYITGYTSTRWRCFPRSLWSGMLNEVWEMAPERKT